MIGKARRKIDAALKAKIALEAVREQASVADLAQRYEVHPPDLRLEEAARRSCGPRGKGRWRSCTPKSGS
jgi:transposase-like protein